MLKFGCGGVFGLVLSGILSIGRLVAGIIASVAVYTGLYVPLLFGILLVCLSLFAGFDIRVTSVDSALAIFGLILSVVAAVIITVRNVIIRPISEVVAYHKDKIRTRKEREKERMEKLYKKSPEKFFKRYPDEDVPNRCPNATAPPPREYDAPPLEYYSKVHPDLFIREYPAYFDVYRSSGGRLLYLERLPKKDMRR